MLVDDATPNQHVIDLLRQFALRAQVRLPAGWTAQIAQNRDLRDPALPLHLASDMGWPVPLPLSRRPRAHDFPFLVLLPDQGWAMAIQWHGRAEISVVTSAGRVDTAWGRHLRATRLAMPAESQSNEGETAVSVFARAVRRRPHALIEAALATVVVNLLALFTSVYSMQVYDRVIPLKGYPTLAVLTAGMLLALLADMVLRNIRAVILDHETAQMDAEVSDHFFERMQAVRLDARPAGIGTMAAQLRGLEQVRAAMTSTSLFVLADLPFAVLFIAFMSMIGGQLALISLIFFPVSILVAVVLARAIREATAQAQVSGNQKNGLLVEALDAAETLKATSGDGHMLRAWCGLVDQVHASEMTIRKWSTFASTAFSALPQLSYVAIIYWGTYLVAERQLTMGGLIACTIVSGRITGPLVATLPSLIIQWGYARQSIQALDRILAMPSTAPLGRRLVDLTRAEGRLRLNGLRFAYPGQGTAIQDVTLSIAPRERVAIIGAVGSGKSTLLRLMGGLYAPSEGAALLDDIDMTQIFEGDLRRHVCYMPQTYRLIGGTLRDNLKLGLPDVTDEALLKAAEETGLGEVIRRNARGLDLFITEGGRGLSGGQAALVGLTRLLLLKPAVVLLDEPTAALDQDSEARALKAVFAALGTTSAIILVTHKMQLLSLVERLLVVVNGKVMLDGPTQNVIDRLRAAAAPAGAQARIVGRGA